jgi:hypothetical protein
VALLGLIGRTWLFVVQNNLVRLVIFAAVILSGALVIWLPTADESVRSAWHAQSVAGFWQRFIPIAQFAAATSLAYLALEYFRHRST